VDLKAVVGKAGVEEAVGSDPDHLSGSTASSP
jgi:hypothetical protein